MLLSFIPPFRPDEKSFGCCCFCGGVVEIIIVGQGSSGGNVDSGFIIGTLSKGNSDIFESLAIPSIIYAPTLALHYWRDVEACITILWLYAAKSGLNILLMRLSGSSASLNIFSQSTYGANPPCSFNTEIGGKFGFLVKLPCACILRAALSIQLVSFINI